jgi:uncharacterized protein (DUF58 family)
VPDQPSYFDPQAIAQLRTLELRARWIVDGYLSGRHRSPLHGFSNEFAQHREYTPGDDWRHVDWKVFGRTDKYYLKQYQDESNLICYLLVDFSPSMAYRSSGTPFSKLDYARSFAASLAWLLLMRRDAVGLVLFDDRIRSWLTPASTPSALPQMLATMEQTESRNESQIRDVLYEVARRLSKKVVVIVLSDFFEDANEVILGLRHLRHDRHDTNAVQILDPAEIEFPFDRTTLFQGLEGNDSLLADAAAMGEAYRKAIRGFCTLLCNECRQSDVAFHQILTTAPFDLSLSQFLTNNASHSDQRQL